MILRVQVASHCFSWTTLPAAKLSGKIAEIVKGVAEGCVQSEAALIGGETAEHPGLMPEDEYDLAGFAVGVVDKKDLLTGEALNQEMS